MDSRVASSSRHHPLRWYNTLVFRTALICAVLLMCLLGSVYVLTSHYFTEVNREMSEQINRIADEISVQLDTSADDDLHALESYYDNDAMRIDLDVVEDEVMPMPVTAQIEEDGRLTKIAQAIIQDGDRRILVTLNVSVTPQSELIRAFQNRYLLGITVLFIVALSLMIYFIIRTLRPLSELSETCAEISEGHLKPVDIGKNTGEVLALEETFNRMVESLKEKAVMETKLRQAQRLSAIGNLAAGVAHDLRNPLNAIKLISSHTIDMVRTGQTPDRAVEQLHTIQTEVNRLEDIVSGFLSLAKERELQPELTRVDSLVEECLHLVAKDAERRGVRLVSELRAGETRLMLDSKQCTRAVLNVIINAMEACPEGGRVRVFTRLTDITCEIEVRDDGPGMDPDTAEHAFDAYFTTKPTGTGLGLSITRGIIEEHGGTVELTSVEGRGCQVLITLPLPSEPHDIAPPPPWYAEHTTANKR